MTICMEMSNMNYNSWWNWNHLREAEKLSGKSRKNILSLYFTHFVISMREAGIQLLLAFASIIHAFIPFAFNFKLLDIVVSQCRGLYRFLPNHPVWKELRKTLDDN